MQIRSGEAYLERMDEAIAMLRHRLGKPPLLLVQLGSGMEIVQEAYDEWAHIRYKELPGFLVPSVEGHEGVLSAGTLHGQDICLLKGRCHYYEGHSLSEVVFPVRTLARWGVSIFILTNAAGGIRSDLTPGRLMLIDDHLNLMGASPLRGEQVLELGERFPDMTECYDPRLRQEFTECATSLSLPLARGIYAAVSGPQLETRSEVDMLERLGADAVGMSTVPEVIALSQMNQRVAAISCVANRAAGLGQGILRHSEIVRQVQLASNDLWLLISEFIRKAKS